MTPKHIKYLVRNLEMESGDGCISRFPLVYLDADLMESKDQEIAYANVVIRKFHREEPGYVYLDNFTVKARDFKFIQ